jgi:hypothetical protein
LPSSSLLDCDGFLSRGLGRDVDPPFDTLAADPLGRLARARLLVDCSEIPGL